MTALVVASPTHAQGLLSLIPEKEGVQLEVMAPYIELRTGPGRGYPITHVAERGENLRAFKRMTDWYKVETTDGIMGWVRRDELDGSRAEDGSIAEFSTPDKLAYEERRWELGVAGGDFSGADGVTTYLSYHLTANISAELKFTQAFGEFSNIKLYSLNAVHQPWPQWRVSPFFTLGSGVMRTFPKPGLVETEDREDSALTVGGGVFIYISRNFLGRIEFNNHSVLTSRTENEEVDEWKAGFSVFF